MVLELFHQVVASSGGDWLCFITEKDTRGKISDSDQSQVRGFQLQIIIGSLALRI